MQHVRNIRGSWVLAALVSLLLSLAACSSDSPSEPRRDPPPTPGGNPPSATFNIDVTADPPQLEAGSDEPSQIRIQVRRRDNGAAPSNGTTMVVTTNLGLFTQTGNNQAVVTLAGGQAFLSLLAGDIPGTAQVRATLEGSVGGVNVRILEEGDFFIDFLEPSVGSPQGGDEVLINGRGFERPVRVNFGGEPAQVLSAGLNRIRVLTPALPGGLEPNQTRAVAVTVTINLNTADQVSDTLPNGFTYSPGGADPEQPLILGVDPTSGPNAGGTRVTLTGQGFSAPAQVLLGNGAVGSFSGIEATVESVTPTRIVFITPPALGLGQDLRNQQVSILVRNTASGFATVSPGAFRYGETVEIAGVSPLEAGIDGGTEITVFGTGFVEPLQLTVGAVGDESETEMPVVSVTPERIVFRTVPINVSGCPANGVAFSGPVNVRLLDAGGVGEDVLVSSDQIVRFTFDLPELFSLSPDNGTQSGGTAVTLSGSGFVAPIQVRFAANGQTFVANVTSVSSTSVALRTPRVTDSAMDTVSCDDNGDGTVGEKFAPTAFDVVLENLDSGCVTDPLENAFVFNPTDTSCRGDAGPPPPEDPVECEDGFDNDGDGFIDADDPECTGPNDDDESA